MDPVTLIGLLGSIASLIEAGKGVLKIVNTLRHCDVELRNLSDDVAMFTEALGGFERVMRSRQVIHRIPAPMLQRVIDNSVRVLQQLEKRLKKILKSEVLIIRRVKWARDLSGIKSLHNRLKEQNVMLQSFLQITYAETFIAFAAQNPQFTSMLSMLNGTSGERSTKEEHQQHSVSQLQALAEKLSNTFKDDTDYAIPAPSRRVTIEESTVSTSLGTAAHQTSKTKYQSSEELSAPVSVTAAYKTLRGISTIRQACRYNCHCQCHEQRTRKPQHTNDSRKKSGARCTTTHCRGYSTVEANFKMQSRSFRKALSQIISKKTVKVQYYLNTYRMVSESCDVMRHVKHGDLDKLKDCIDTGIATIWDTAPDGWSLLHTATYHCHIPIVRYLLELGVDLDVADVGTRKPADLAFLKAIGQDAEQGEREMLEIFTQKDDFLTEFEFTPIHIAILGLYDSNDREKPSLEELIELNDECNNASANTDWTKMKLEYKQRSPLFGSVIEYFRASAYELGSSMKVIHRLIDQKDKKYDWTPLHWATSSGKVDKMKILVDRGANPFLLSRRGCNIIHAAVESKKSLGLKGALDIWRRNSDRLDINQRNSWEETPLHLASWASADCVQHLLDAGADANVQQEDGQTPLQSACLSAQGTERPRIISLLCNTTDKAHISNQDLDGRSSIFEVLGEKACLEILIRNGAALDLVDKSGKNIVHHACILGYVDSLEIILRSIQVPEPAVVQDEEGNTPLLCALENNEVGCAKTLLELGHLGDSGRLDGWTAAHFAARLGDAQLLEMIFQHQSFKRGMKTADDKIVEIVAMEAGNWNERVKVLVRQYDSICAR